MVPVTFTDIGLMLNSVVKGFQDYILLSFVMMCTFSIALFVRQLLVGGRI